MKSLFLLAACIHLFFALPVYAGSIKQPAISLENVKLLTVGLNGALIEVSLDVYNPNTTDISVEWIRYNLMVSNIPVKRGHIHQATTFPAKRQRSLKVPVELAYDQNLSTLLAIISSSQPAEYVIKGDIKLKSEKQLQPFYHRDRLSLGNQ